MKAYKFRIYPNKEQKKVIDLSLWLSKELWNNMLSSVKDTYNSTKKFPSKKELREITKNKGLYSQTAQELTDRLIDSLKHKINMKKKGLKGGFPRFKSFDKMKSLFYPQYNGSFMIIGNKLRVSKIGNIKIVLHRAIEGEIKTLTIKRECSGIYYAIFCAEQKIITKQNNGEQTGIDVGLKNFATLSNGEIIDNPRHFKKYEKQLAMLQRQHSKKYKGSKNRYKSRIRIAKLHHKIKNARNDFLHKQSYALVNKYSLIALEKLNILNMAQQGYGKFINDASWNRFTNYLTYKAESAGCRIIFVDAKNTTRQCSNCEAIVEKSISDRQHICSCGLNIDRDLNASINILTKATCGQRGSNACGELDASSSTNQEAHTFK